MPVRSPAGDALRRVAARARLGLGSLVARQVDLEHGALVRRAVDKDEAAGLLDDAVDRRQAEPGAGADLLGREERLEDALDVLLRDADPGIGDLDQHVVAGRHGLGAAPRTASSCATLLVRIVSVPPSVIASRALTARLMMTCSSWP